MSAIKRTLNEQVTDPTDVDMVIGKLRSLPLEIAAASKSQLRLTTQKLELTEKMAVGERNAASIAAANKENSNADKRKAAALEILAGDEHYQALRSELAEVTAEIEGGEIYLRQLGHERQSAIAEANLLAAVYGGIG